MDQLSSRLTRSPHVDLALRPPLPIGPAVVYPETRELHGDGHHVRLEPRVMQVLLTLADACGRTVTRDELFDACWQGTIVDESALNRVITQIRRAAAETGSPFTVHTVTKVGYRLEPAQPSSDGPTPSRDIDRRAWLVGAGGVSVVAAVALAGLAYRPTAGEKDAAELERRAKVALADMLPSRDSEAIAMLTEAAALDPGRPTIWGTLALAHQRAVEMGPWSEARASLERTRSAARQALTLDPGNADAVVALALVAPVYRNWLEAERAYQRLSRRFPRHPPLLAGYAKMLAEVGRFGGAMRLFDRVFRVEPLAPAWHWRRGMGLWAANRPGEAVQLLDKAQRVWPQHPSIWAASFWVNAYTGSPDRSLAMLALPAASGLAQPQHDFMKRSAEALAGSKASHRAETLARNRIAAAQNTSTAEQAMAVAAALGDDAEAMAIARAYHFGEEFTVGDARLESGTHMTPERRKTLPLFWPPMARVRRSPEFRDLVQRLGLTAYWAASGTPPDYAGVG